MPKFDAKLSVSPFSQVLIISYPLNCIDDTLEQCLTTSRGKNHGKKMWGSKSVPKLFFCHSLNFGSLVLFGIAQGCSLVQFITSSRDEICKDLN